MPISFWGNSFNSLNPSEIYRRTINIPIAQTGKSGTKLRLLFSKSSKHSASRCHAGAKLIGYPKHSAMLYPSVLSFFPQKHIFSGRRDRFQLFWGHWLQIRFMNKSIHLKDCLNALKIYQYQILYSGLSTLQLRCKCSFLHCSVHIILML